MEHILFYTAKYGAHGSEKLENILSLWTQNLQTANLFHDLCPIY